MASVRECVEASTALMAALGNSGDLGTVLSLIEGMTPDQVVLTIILFRTEPKATPEDLSGKELDPTSRKDVRAALRQVYRQRAAADLHLLDENLGDDIGPREIIDYARGSLELEDELHARICEGVARDTAMLVLIDRVGRAIPEPPE